MRPEPLDDPLDTGRTWTPPMLRRPRLERSDKVANLTSEAFYTIGTSIHYSFGPS